MDEPIPCPQCGAPAPITDRFWSGSTAGPVEPVKTGCVNNHWLTPLAGTLATQSDPARRPSSPRPTEPVTIQARQEATP
jgi:hypothetical protein